ncbi:MAG: cob(I)yrinic acid a,c-diamide adenosyltransferase [Deltaproteobacteria bacterium]|nr:cob(I)yrinic acid a,c-diamide adenosyltransferase [Deltaproteobacteria bacterium]
MKGYVQVYTGEGKGKTTAAFGLMLRAVGAGLHVYIAQFVKGLEYSELEAVEKLSDLVTIKQYGSGCFIRKAPSQEDIRFAREGFQEVKQIIDEGRHELVILDEANIAIYYNLFSIEELLDLIDKRPEHVELVITGRNAHEKLLKKADLVTEMREVKHYYKEGVLARTGIEK